MLFAVFFVRNGQWVQWTSGARSYCESERDYLANMLGLTAKVFQKESK